MSVLILAEIPYNSERHLAIISATFPPLNVCRPPSTRLAYVSFQLSEKLDELDKAATTQEEKSSNLKACLATKDEFESMVRSAISLTETALDNLGRDRTQEAAVGRSDTTGVHLFPPTIVDMASIKGYADSIRETLAAMEKADNGESEELSSSRGKLRMLNTQLQGAIAEFDKKSGFLEVATMLRYWQLKNGDDSVSTGEEVLKGTLFPPEGSMARMEGSNRDQPPDELENLPASFDHEIAKGILISEQPIYISQSGLKSSHNRQFCVEWNNRQGMTRFWHISRNMARESKRMPGNLFIEFRFARLGSRSTETDRWEGLMWGARATYRVSYSPEAMARANTPGSRYQMFVAEMEEEFLRKEHRMTRARLAHAICMLSWPSAMEPLGDMEGDGRTL